MARKNTQRRLAAIVSVDVVGFSRMMEADEEGTLASLKAHLHELAEPLIGAYGGRIVKRTGDGLLLEFTSVVEAVRYSVDVQTEMAARNAAIDETNRIEFRIGVNLGDVITDSNGDIFGNGVNIAARLQSIAEAGGVCISQAVAEEIRQKVEVELDDLGEKSLKNIKFPVHAYRVKPNPTRKRNIAAQSEKLPTIGLRSSTLTTIESKSDESNSILDVLKNSKQLTFIGQGEFWVTGDYDTCKEILDHPAFRRPHWSLSNEDAGQKRSGVKQEQIQEFSEWPIFDADQTRSSTKYLAVRLLLNLNYSALRDYFSSISRHFINTVRSREEFDLFEEYCSNITIAFSAHIFGIPKKDMKILFDYSMDINKTIGSIQTSNEDIINSTFAYKKLNQYILDELHRIKAGMMGASILSAENEYGIEPVVRTLSMLVFGANTTTPMMISNLACFLGESEENIYIAEKATSSDINREMFIHELLRLYSPTLAIPRIAIEDTTVSGQDIKKDLGVYCSIWAANRDSKIFPNPERFMPSRVGAKRNLSFGSKGHKCIGQRLDFLELTICMRDLVQLFYERRLSGCDMSYLDTSINTHGFRSLTMVKRDQTLEPSGGVTE